LKKFFGISAEIDKAFEKIKQYNYEFKLVELLEMRPQLETLRNIFETTR
jgi:arsenate reductase-like glutaredoxin family protein